MQVPAATSGKKVPKSFASREEKEAYFFDYLSQKVSKDVELLTREETIDRNEGMAFYEKRLAKNPRLARAHHCMAPMVASTGNLRKTISHYQCAITYNPMDYEAMNDLAVVLLKVCRQVVSMYKTESV